MDPGNYMTHSLLGQAYRRIGRVADAKKEFDRADQIQNARKAPAPSLSTPQ